MKIIILWKGDDTNIIPSCFTRKSSVVYGEKAIEPAQFFDSKTGERLCHMYICKESLRNLLWTLHQSLDLYIGRHGTHFRITLLDKLTCFFAYNILEPLVFKRKK